MFFSALNHRPMRAAVVVVQTASHPWNETEPKSSRIIQSPRIATKSIPDHPAEGEMLQYEKTIAQMKAKAPKSWTERMTRSLLDSETAESRWATNGGW